MQVTLKNSFTTDQPIDRVWEFLSDPYKVAPCLPGAEILEMVDDKTYRVHVLFDCGLGDLLH